jgi:hypothetical protein
MIRALRGPGAAAAIPRLPPEDSEAPRPRPGGPADAGPGRAGAEQLEARPRQTGWQPFFWQRRGEVGTHMHRNGHTAKNIKDMLLNMVYHANFVCMYVTTDS